MLEIKLIREEKDRVIAGLTKRNLSEEILGYIDRVVVLDDERKNIQRESDELLASSKVYAKQIGGLIQKGNSGDLEAAKKAEALKNEVAGIKERISELDSRSKNVVQEMNDLLYEIPNIPAHVVPKGKLPEDNEVVKLNADTSENAKAGGLPHWELGEKYRLFDFTLGTKLTGSGFPVFMGKGAALERALITFFINEAVKAGYEEVIPPLLVNEDTARGTGQLPDKEGQMYHATKDNFYLIPTAEVPVTNIFRDEILDGSSLPIKKVAYTPCFRREAGSYGSDVKGLNRVHQFDKVEIVQFSHPDKSYDQLQEMLDHVESLLIKLGLPYRILRLCGGDMGFTSALTYDFEVYSIAQKKWLEVSSVSNFETYQSNRMKIRFRSGTEKPTLVHTLNGSALALPRIVAGILEYYQTNEGIKIPEVLQPYTGFDLIEK
ncbi:MAG: serine--tRNA ligase [Saprospirales bacterium]|nr:MAG: serine--tRNA ligase [Saprospirales bacterium]